MTVYTAPSKDLKFVIETLADYPAWHSKSGSDFDLETVSAVIDEAARFAEQVLAPINRLGDQQGAKLSEQGVTAPKEFVDAYRQFVDSGWNSLGAPTEHGGQGGPKVLGAALQEIWQAANMAWSLCPMLSQGAVEALVAHGSTEQKKTYLPKLISGAWAGTMVLTEPQAGSDLGALQCKATPAGDHYLIQGQKIFITWGEHNMADNIVHLVLARLPDAPPGVKGISMFLVPRFLLNDDGSVGKANDLHCSALEHKLGIHASPTCVMNYGDNEGAIGYLIGEENQGLALMFTMMNDARLAVGIEGIGVADRAYQLARDYAKQRVQGNLPGEKERVTIIHHPNVRRMLLLMKTQIEAMRAVAITTAMTMDRCAVMKGNEEQFWQKVVSLLVPVVKAWCTETAQE
ncbi:MAG: acyl-CoA dehydrogenase, partial [Gammaproteobacteria bacterium]|nr:acyl-CoA dehydrogenase [Gammaproteobacteria bacterium]